MLSARLAEFLLNRPAIDILALLAVWLDDPHFPLFTHAGSPSRCVRADPHTDALFELKHCGEREIRKIHAPFRRIQIMLTDSIDRHFQSFPVVS